MAKLECLGQNRIFFPGLSDYFKKKKVGVECATVYVMVSLEADPEVRILVQVVCWGDKPKKLG